MAVPVASGKVVVTGASGLLGREVLKCFSQAGWDCLGLAYSRARSGLKRVDLCDREQVEKVLSEFQPHVVIHAAAERRPDALEKAPKAAKSLNVDATSNIAELCNKYKAYLLYVSTDYVFDGKNPPYKPDDATNPLNAYGQSKREGELAVLAYPNHAVLRIPVLYGPVEELGESAVTTLFSAVLNPDKPANMSDYEKRYPTHVSDIASACLGLCKKRLLEDRDGALSGVWHWSGNECLTKYQMACIMAEAFGLPSSHLVPVREPSQGAPRPYNTQLDHSSTEKVLSGIPLQRTPFREGIHKVLLPFYKGD